MKTKTKYLISLLALMIILCCLIIDSNKYKNAIAKLQKENKELKHTNKELMTSVESLYTQLNNAYDIECDCTWYEDFYYEHMEEMGAME